MELFTSKPRVSFREPLNIGWSPEDGGDQLWRVSLEEGDRSRTITVRTFRRDWRTADEVSARLDEVIARLPKDESVIDQIIGQSESLRTGGSPYFNLSFADD